MDHKFNNKAGATLNQSSYWLRQTGPGVLALSSMKGLGPCSRVLPSRPRALNQPLASYWARGWNNPCRYFQTHSSLLSSRGLLLKPGQSQKLEARSTTSLPRALEV